MLCWMKNQAPWFCGSSWHHTISVAFGYFFSSVAMALCGNGYSCSRRMIAVSLASRSLRVLTRS
ncbi:hypothetical protein D3C81_1104930 [compost metagenome]